MKIYLVGYMASGKSRLGQDLATELGYDFIDLDEIFESRYHISISDFFEKYDEQNFRRIERSLLQETADYCNTVIATGGGTPCFFDNMEFILNQGISVYLLWDASALILRLNQIRRKRPLISKLKADALEVYIRKHLQEREVFYRQADLIADMKLENFRSLVGKIRKKIDSSESLV